MYGALGLLLISLLTSHAGAEECNFAKGLSTYQKGVMHKAYEVGAPKNLGYTLIAVAWKESKLGKYKARYGSRQKKLHP